MELVELVETKGSELSSHPFGDGVVIYAEAALRALEGGDAQVVMEAAVREYRGVLAGVEDTSLSVIDLGGGAGKSKEQALGIKVEAVRLAKRVIANVITLEKAVVRLSLDISSGVLADAAVAEAWAALEACRDWQTLRGIDKVVVDRKVAGVRAVAAVEGQAKLARGLGAGNLKAMMADEGFQTMGELREFIGEARAVAAGFNSGEVEISKVGVN